MSRMRWVALLGLLAGCDQVFNLSQVGVGMGAGAYPDGSSMPSTAIFDEQELCGP